MIRRLTGHVIDVQAGSVVIDVNGIGYVVAIPNQPEYIGLHGDITLETYLAVRDTALDLYGFLTSLEHTCFCLLLNIPKIGPKSALAVLSQARPEMIAEAVAANDPNHLHKVSGLGKKTCESIVHYFRSKDISLGVNLTSALSSSQSDAIEALITLGYDQNRTRELVREQAPDTPLNELITFGIKNL